MKTASLTDNFDAALDGAIWTTNTGAYTSHGELVFPVNPTGVTLSTGYSYDMLDSHLYIELANLPMQSGTEFDLEFGALDAGFDISPTFRIVNNFEGDERYYLYFSESGDLSQFEPFDPAEDRWLRIRYSTDGQTLYWETSRDGIVWIERHTSGTPSLYDPNTLASVKVYIHTNDTSGEGDYLLHLDNLNLPKLPDPSSQPSYVYKHYKAGVYQGTLKVGNELNFTSEIGANSAPMTVIIPTDLELTSPSYSDNFIVDEVGDNIIDKNGNSLLYSSAFSIEGVPTVGDVITVTEFSAFYPRGLVIYSGIVITLATNYADNNVELQCLSEGVRLDNYLVNIKDEQSVVSSASANATIGVSQSTTPTSALTSRIAQTFQVASATDVTSVDVDITALNAAPVGYSFYIRQGTPLSAGSTLYSASGYFLETGSTKIKLAMPVSLAASTTYFFELRNTSGNHGARVEFSISSTAGYANGAEYAYSNNGGWVSTAYDMVFTINEASGTGVNQFNSYDPGVIARELLEGFEQTAGTVKHSDSSVRTTSTTVSYTFTFNTYYEALKKCVELAPSNWYFSVDPGTGLVTFDRKRGAVHILTKGKVSHFDVALSLEDVINNVYFSGGDTGAGKNLLVNKNDAQSIEDYGQWLNLPTDSRVTDQTSGELIAQGLIDQHSQPRLRSAGVEVPISYYNISALRQGQVVTFAGYAPIINDAELQIVRVQRYADRVRLALEVLPPSVTKRIEDIRRNLLVQETLNNPEL